MSERERWIVYPLLFLALGAALRDKLSEQTRTKRIECQELIVFGDDSAGRQPVPLVQIGAAQRPAANSPHVGQILVNGQLAVDSIQARSIDADNYYYHQIPFAPTLLRTVPGILPPNWFRALQQSAEALGADAKSGGQPAKGDTRSQRPAEPAAATPPAE